MAGLISRGVGLCLIAIGIPIFILPIPFGFIFIGVGMAMVYGHNLSTIRVAIDRRRQRSQYFQWWYGLVRNICPLFIRNWFRKLSTSSHPL